MQQIMLIILMIAVEMNLVIYYAFIWDMNHVTNIQNINI